MSGVPIGGRAEADRPGYRQGQPWDEPAVPQLRARMVGRAVLG